MDAPEAMNAASTPDVLVRAEAEWLMSVSCPRGGAPSAACIQGAMRELSSAAPWRIVRQFWW
jgi:hypothetical protein